MPKLRDTGRGVPIAHAWVRPTPSRTPAGQWHPPVVYYMRFDSLVKIGTTRRIAQRLREIPNEGLLAVEYGTASEERERHRQFGHLRRTGEWFEFTPELGLHIVDIREQFAAAQGITVEAWLARYSQPS